MFQLTKEECLRSQIVTLNKEHRKEDSLMSENQIIVYQPDDTLRLDVRLENETVCLTQSLLGELFGVERTVVNRHIRNIYKSVELEETATCAKNAQVQMRGTISFSCLQTSP